MVDLANVESVSLQGFRFNNISSSVTSLLHRSLSVHLVLLTLSRGVTLVPSYYIMMDVGAASLLDSCGTLDDDDLNTSDHLPQSVRLEFPCKPTEAPESARIIINWSNIESSGALTPYKSEVNAVVTPYLGRIHADIESLNEEVEIVAKKTSKLLQT